MSQVEMHDSGKKHEYSNKNIQIAMQDDAHLQDLRMYIMEGWSSYRNDVNQDLQPY